MRKLFYYFTPSGWLLLGLFICLIIVIITGCAGISLKAPTTQMFVDTGTYFIASKIGKAEPEIAKEIIEKTKSYNTDVLANLENWKEFVVGKLKDPIHKKLVRDMLALVEVDLQLKSPIEQEKVIRELFKEFISGLKAGIDGIN